MTKPRTHNKKSGSTADEARSINKSLRRTQALLQQELERVSHVSEAIDSDGKLLNQTKDHQRDMNETVKGANAALRNLQLQQKKEFLILMASVVFFYLVAGYALWTRIPLPLISWQAAVRVFRSLQFTATLIWTGETVVT
mmetsp:Transcript_5216/g.9019  ORF Transcript_5216/g.9019 Transcript_5216/m.9019 type:complete len:140 (-) Transcript_5216:703-1122(-)